MIKQLALCFLTLGIASSAYGSACVSGTLSSYITQGSCTVGSYTFNNFLFLAVNVLSPGVDAKDITVNATFNATGPNVTFTPDALLQATGVVSVADYILGFEVTSTNPSIGFSGVNLSETGSVTGLSTAAIAELDCYGGLLQLPNPITGIVGLGCLSGGVAVGGNVSLPLGTTGTVNANIEFQKFTTTVDVLKDITLAGVLGGASVTGIGQQFSTGAAGTTVPEPTSLFLGGCGLIGLALVGRRKLKPQPTAHDSSLLSK
jgi:hypothetical protein